MLYARTSAGEIVSAVRGINGFCPLCKSPLRAKCGSINVKHWAHLASDCDPWSEPEGPWHCGWKELFPAAWREVSMGPHRADVRLPTGRVVELQHSTISAAEIQAREAFYGNMVWIFDARKADVGLRNVEYVGESDTYYTPEGDPISHPQYSIDFDCFRDLKALPSSGQRIKFQWRRAKPSVLTCKRPVFLDLADDLLISIEWSKPGCMSMYGRLFSRASLLGAL